MTRAEIIALKPGKELDDAVANVTGDEMEYSTDEAALLALIYDYGLTVTPKQNTTDDCAWLADHYLKDSTIPWEGYGPTLAIAVCRAVLLPTATDNDRSWQSGELARKHMPGR